MNYLQKKKKAMLNYVSGGGLPSEYQECEYIESDGQQYIDSGTPLGFDYGFDVKFYNKSRVASSNYGAIFGCRTPYYELSSYVLGGTLRWGVFSRSATPYMLQNSVQECSLHNGVFTDCNGNETTLTKVADDTTRNCYLFGWNDAGTFAQGGSGCRIYYLKLYYQNDMIRNFIPCYHKTSGEIGMYDTVTKQFYTNAGSGTFTKGNDV